LFPQSPQPRGRGSLCSPTFTQFFAACARTAHCIRSWRRRIRHPGSRAARRVSPGAARERIGALQRAVFDAARDFRSGRCTSRSPYRRV